MNGPRLSAKLTKPIVAHHTFLNPATAVALDKFVPAKTSYVISGGSILLSLFLFILKFQLFLRQARALCCARRRFFKKTSDRFIHSTDDINPNSDSSFFIMTHEDKTALGVLAKKVSLKTEANAPFTYSSEVAGKLYPDITA